MEPAERLKEYVIYLCENYHLGEDTLADVVGVDVQTIRRALNGEQICVNTVKKILWAERALKIANAVEQRSCG